MGSSFGWPGGWIAVQLGLVVLAVRLVAAENDAPRAGRLLAAFVFFLYAVGQFGLAAAVPASLRPWTLLVWVSIAFGHAAIAGLTGYGAFRLPLPGRAGNSARLLLAIPALWVGREWLASYLDVSVPWLTLGSAQAPDGPFAALLPIGGIFLAGWVSLIGSFGLGLAWRRNSPKPRLIAVGGVVAGVAVAMASGSFQWTRPSARTVIELVQSGVSPEGDRDRTDIRRTLRFYAEVVAASTAALIVTPQLAIPKTPGSLPTGYLSDLDATLRDRNADALLGMYFESQNPNAYFNGVQVLGVSGAQRYLKHHLFPFGEFMPFSAGISRWINSKLEHPNADGARGPVAKEPLLGGGFRLAIAVCYEAVFGQTLRLQAAAADVIVNLASDATHDSPQLARQARQIAQARALEFQKPVVRTSDVRGTYFVDWTGRVSGELPAGQRGTVAESVQGRSGLTPYAQWGDALAVGAAGLSICAALLLSAFGQGLLGSRPAIRFASVETAPSRSTCPLRQAGQVLPVALALLVIVAGFFYMMVNAGQTVTEKMRVTNAADAAAYSAGVVEARALNYDAYLNRAMVANQMAIAQMVSFASWIDYFATAADNFGAYVADMNMFVLPNPKVAVLDVAFGGSAFVAAYFGGSTVHEYADYVVDYGAGAIITVHDIATQSLSLSQRLVQANLTAGIRQRQIADQVVKAMDPKLSAEVVLLSHGFDAFTKNYAGDERTRFADVAIRSRDPFTRERNFTVDSFDIPLVRKNGALKKRGGTELIDLDEWRGVDTLELHGQRFGCGRFGLSWCDDIRTPIGWGAIEVDAGGGDAGSGYHGNAYNENPTTAGNADSAMRSPTLGYFTGTPRSQEIADVDPTHDASTGITVLVSKSQSDTLTSANAATVKPSGSLAVFGDRPAGGRLAALSRAQVFFDRIAARADGKTELGSTYNPYWRVRLVSPTVADRAYAATKQGGLFLPTP